MNNFFYNGYGCNYEYYGTAKTDCFFYSSEINMGITIKTCMRGKPKRGECECNNCKNYLSKKDAIKILNEYLDKNPI